MIEIPNIERLNFQRISEWIQSPYGLYAYFRARKLGTFYFVKYRPYGFSRINTHYRTMLQNSPLIAEFVNQNSLEAYETYIEELKSLISDIQIRNFGFAEFLDAMTIISISDDTEPTAYVMFNSYAYHPRYVTSSQIYGRGDRLFNYYSDANMSPALSVNCGDELSVSNLYVPGIDIPSLFVEVLGGERQDYLNFKLIVGGREGVALLHKQNKMHKILPGIVSGWQFDSMDDGIIIDRYGANNGVLIPMLADDYELLTGFGAAVMPGAVSRPKDSAGKSGVVVLSPTGLDFEDGSFTISGWIKTTSPHVTLYRQKGESAYDIINLSLTNGQFVFSLFIDGLVYQVETEESVLYNDGQYHHFAVVVDRELHNERSDVEGTLVCVTVDGDEVASADGIPLDSLNETTELYLAECPGDQILSDEMLKKGDFDFETDEMLSDYWDSEGWEDEPDGPEATVALEIPKTLSQKLSLKQGHSYRVSAEIELGELELASSYDFSLDDTVIYIYSLPEFVFAEPHNAIGLYWNDGVYPSVGSYDGSTPVFKRIIGNDVFYIWIAEISSVYYAVLSKSVGSHLESWYYPTPLSENAWNETTLSEVEGAWVTDNGEFVGEVGMSYHHAPSLTQNYFVDVYLGSTLVESVPHTAEVDSNGIYKFDKEVVLGQITDSEENLRFVLRNVIELPTIEFPSGLGIE